MTIMERLLSLLLAFFRLGQTPAEPQEGDQPGEENPGEGGGGDDGEPDPDDISALFERAEAASAEPEDTETPPAVKEERRLRKVAEDALAEERRLREAFLARSSAAPSGAVGGGSGDPDYDREEAEIARAVASGDQATIDNARWTATANRAIRQSQRTAAAAYFASNDMADKTDFAQLQFEKPKLYRRYKDRVEAKLQEIRRGNPALGIQPTNLPRRAIYLYLLGEDSDKAIVKPRGQRQGPADETVRVDRGRSPTFRSDARGGEKQTNKQKLEKKLENLRI